MTFARRFVLAICLLQLLAVFAFAQEDSSQSLADVARKLRKETSDEVRMTDADTKKLFESVDRIFSFSSQDSGMPKHSAVKRRLVSKADVVKYTSGLMAKEEYTQRFAREELSMKKLGFLPREFNLREFLVKSTGNGIAGYYDPDTKMISLLNWVPADRQEPILAHELTHALQDQNYDLRKWMKAADKPVSATKPEDDDGAIARKAVVEGSAMVVYVDYLLAPVGRNLQDTPGLIYSMEDPAVKAVQDSQMLHDAPMILREAGTFAYKEGLIFEGELLHKGGKKMAFEGAFVRPPRNSHQILEPDTYINNEKLASLGIPYLSKLIGTQYDIFDSGGVGQLDVRAYLKQYGERRIADEVSSGWQGGSYFTFKKKTPAATDATSTADLALLYISRWKTPQMAEHYAQFYGSTVAQRYHNATLQNAPACSGPKCPAATLQFATEEGPVLIERWADNTVIVSESFDADIASKISEAVRDNAAHAAITPGPEIGLRLFEIPAFDRFAAQIGDNIAAEIHNTR